MIAPAPIDLRSLFTLFLLYDPNTGIDGWLKRIDLSGVDRRQVYRSVLGRNPETVALSRTGENYRPAAHLTDTLNSDEFQDGLIKLLLRAFPERRRVIFVHIPKCAGTDLIAKIVNRFPAIDYTLTSDAWNSKPDVFAALHRIVSDIYCSKSLFVYGHMSLPWLMRHDLIRCEDDCFTVLRDPDEMVISQVNYILTRIFAPAGTSRTDVRQWLSALGIEGPISRPSEAETLALAKSVLWNEDLTPRNVICRQLGVAAGDADATASSAMGHLIMSNIEITETLRYDRWTQQKFGSSQFTRKNKSEAILKPSDLSAGDQEYIASITSEDRKLYDHVVQKLNQAGSLSIRGGAL
jgi:hypothetical protein